MILYPALDIVEGAVVRLREGDFGALTRYDADPLARARAFVGEGAKWLHVVDLDGARAGRPCNLATVAALAQQSGAAVQVGGGLRTMGALADLFAAGAARAVLGTAALEDRQLLRAALERYGPQRIAVSVDARGGEALRGGWLGGSGMTATEVLRQMVAEGVETLIFTDVERDGTLAGLSRERLEEAVGAATGAQLIASGGVAALADLELLLSLAQPPAGVIVGKAIYERRFTVGEALAVLAGGPATV